MALSFVKLFQPIQLPGSAAAIFTIAGPNTQLLRNGRVRLTNTTSGAVASTLYAVPSGGAAGASNEFFAGQSIAPNSYVDVDVPQLAIGDAIWGFAGATSSISIAAMDGVLQS